MSVAVRLVPGGSHESRGPTAPQIYCMLDKFDNYLDRYSDTYREAPADQPPPSTSGRRPHQGPAS